MEKSYNHLWNIALSRWRHPDGVEAIEDDLADRETAWFFDVPHPRDMYGNLAAPLGLRVACG